MSVLGFVANIQLHLPEHFDARENKRIDASGESSDVLQDAVDAIAKPNLVFLFRLEVNVARSELDGADHDGLEDLCRGNFEDAVLEREEIAEFLFEFLEVAVGKIDFEMVEIVEKKRLFVRVPGVFERRSRCDVYFRDEAFAILEISNVVGRFPVVRVGDGDADFLAFLLKNGDAERDGVSFGNHRNVFGADGENMQIDEGEASFVRECGRLSFLG